MTSSKNRSTAGRSLAISCSASRYRPARLCCSTSFVDRSRARVQFPLRLLRKQIRAHRGQLPPRFRARLFENFPDALERDGQRLEVLGLANGPNRFHPANGIDQIIRACGERRVDLVVGEAAALLQNESRAVEKKLKDLLLDSR